jgi:hypothetical protein
MRRAIEQPCLLLEHLSFHPQAALQGQDALERWCASRGEQPPPWRYQSPQGRAWLQVSTWETGRLAQEARQRSLEDAQARAVLPGLEEQLGVHLLIQRGQPWPAPDASFALVEVTRDVQPSADPARRGKRPPMPQREDLPAVEGAWIWPVAGHQGRLLMLCAQDHLEAATEALVQAWGPLAEPPRTWSMRPPQG